MKTIAHLSDLHFGRVDERVVENILHAVHSAKPDIVVVSGDFVQNGTRSEFALARDFVRQLPGPKILVPGNHDLPFLNLFRRATVRLSWYREFICEELSPFYSDNEVAILGITTARVWPIRGGRINEVQIRKVEETLGTVDKNLVTILVTHHPFDLEESYHRRELVGRARKAMARFAQTVDLMLAGHMHVSHAGHTAVRYKFSGKSAIFVQAGTATSTRGRGEPNVFNLIHLDAKKARVEKHRWNSEQQHFFCAHAETFDFADKRHPATMPLNEQAIDPSRIEVQYAPQESVEQNQQPTEK